MVEEVRVFLFVGAGLMFSLMDGRSVGYLQVTEAELSISCPLLLYMQ
jgi:hypothetical protein